MYFGAANYFEATNLGFIIESKTRGIGMPELIKDHMSVENERIIWRKRDYLDRVMYMEMRVDGVPSQCGMAIIYSMEAYRMDETAVLLEAWTDIEAIFKALKYSSVMCTVNANQVSTKQCLKRVGFKETFTWKNKRSGNQCFQLIKEIEF